MNRECQFFVFSWLTLSGCIGGSIGAGFFVGSGGALAKGGPASLLIDFAIIGVMMFNVGKKNDLVSLFFQLDMYAQKKKKKEKKRKKR